MTGIEHDDALGFREFRGDRVTRSFDSAAKDVEPGTQVPDGTGGIGSCAHRK